MGLTKDVHFKMDPEQYRALERLAQRTPRPTGERTTTGRLFREAIAMYLAERGAVKVGHGSEPRPRAASRKPKRRART